MADLASPNAPLDSIVLGTAQLGLGYGRRRMDGLMPEDAVVRILDGAWQLGIRAFDTSEAYGLAAPRLATWLSESGNLAHASVITKVLVSDIATEGRLEAASARFRGAAVLTLLSHGATDGETWRTLQRWARGSEANFGQSVYTASEVSRARALDATRIQAPGNVLDTRQVEVAHAEAIPIDIRSVFLQGILLDDPVVAERRVAGGGALAAGIQSSAAAVGLRPAVALLAGMHAMLAPADRLVVGIDDLRQLDDIREMLNAAREPLDEFLALVSSLRESVRRTPHLLDPRTWS